MFNQFELFLYTQSLLLLSETSVDHSSIPYDSNQEVFEVFGTQSRNQMLLENHKKSCNLHHEIKTKSGLHIIDIGPKRKLGREEAKIW